MNVHEQLFAHGTYQSGHGLVLFREGETGEGIPPFRWDRRRFVATGFLAYARHHAGSHETIDSNSRLFMSLTLFHPRRSLINIRCVSTALIADHLILESSSFPSHFPHLPHLARLSSRHAFNAPLRFQTERAIINCSYIDFRTRRLTA